MKNYRKPVFTLIFLIGFFLIILAGTAAGEELIILHTNDIHGRINLNLDDGQMGMPLISALIEQYRSEYDNVLVMDAGDTIHGRPITDRLHGRSTVETMNAAGYDLMVPGNHDFNFGYDRLLELTEIMEFDLISANVFQEGELLFTPYVIREFENFRVGIFGLSTPDTYSTTHPNNIVGIEFGDMVEAAAEYVALLQEEEVDLVVALGHVGFGRNYPSTDIVKEVEGIHLFVDGHSHSRLSRGEWHNNTLFVQAHEYSNYLGKVVIDFSEAEPTLTASLISAAEAADLVEPDAAVEAMLSDFSDEVRQIMLGN